MLPHPFEILQLATRLAEGFTPSRQQAYSWKTQRSPRTSVGRAPCSPGYRESYATYRHHHPSRPAVTTIDSRYLVVFLIAWSQKMPMDLAMSTCSTLHLTDLN